ncbi:polyribonucleotide nucleotidyltransferase [Rhodothalassium salexigens DSM 2132]|uniref:Polyribonucleotide nucleotidyltransferase n=1 Tax=Rhodothalassium salexigens DSM 2132 TaxID=1188247 RepID=A0A4R2PLX1_RHOSA|nr:polyribonucleotide nucleotidyltransferase [Rhodothalassium salexigens]MBB4211279.1 polyribonucleotide nucleotidyltransferase [Rhodothalassium salexigens DSM 2132]MBK1639603.1 polyribonucleotide nucleotidyltransferase [Rhodothalassium salexigens DSM 2132]TCP35201.1 polyribonucleotide nucleotidyltransferase [Rhodothalassium salexigens DSM 2132]
MFDIYRKTLEWGGRTLTIETGHIARQADGAVLATYGETAVLCTVCAARSVKPGQDFFPLTVNYQEKTYAAGKIPGGFFKREGRPSEKETLTSRLIDRPIRPLFPADFKNDTQVICTVLSHDMENDPDVVAMIGASAALTLSGIPFLGPIAGARVGYTDGQYILNPTLAQMEDTALDLVVAGTQQAVLMVESEAKELDEETMLGAVMFGHKQMQPVVDAIIELAEEAAKEPWDLPEPADHGALEAEIRDLVLADLEAAYQITEKQARTQAVAAAKDKMVAAFEGRDDIEPLLLADLFKGLEKSIVRGNILDGKPRIDGRALDQVRPILSEVEVLPRSHGSALFTRGETQALVVVTLGTGEDEQIVDALSGSYREHFMLHYNFPPYSVGETGRVGFTGRREIGHGKLAYRAIKGVMPTRDAFPYTIRVVSEITESNGSSSMATVCGTSLALMDAGVPITRPVSGIAMGLIKDGDRFAVLSDILGDEDHLGDMDFKVAGTDEGITSLQMDIKITGITEEIMSKALAQAKGGRDHIMGEMGRAISDSRTEMSRYAPRIETISIPTEKIREVIGTGGKVIREIVETTGAKVDIEDDGTIKIASADGDKIEAAKKWITGIVAEPEIGHIYDGKVVRIMDFGAFVNFIGSRDGLVHISELTEDRVNKVTDVVNEGDMVKVKVLDVDDRGKVRLSMRLVNQETGEELEDTRPAKKPGGGRKG